MFDPATAYAELAVDSGHARPWAALRRPLLVALVIGAATSLSATGRLTLGLVLSGAACWSFVPAIQLGTATLILRSPRTRLSTSRRLDLWFIAHGPWSLWLLSVAALVTWATDGWMWPIVFSSIIPIVWTAWMARAYCRTILQDTTRQARVRITKHQVLTWTIVLVYIALAAQLWPRFLAVIGR